MSNRTTINRKRQLEASRRRAFVSRLMLSGEARSLSTREIALKLAEGELDLDGIPDPETVSINPNGKPWSHQTIANDLEEIEAAWQKEALTDLATQKQRALARLEGIFERCFTGGDFALSLKTVDQIVDLLGLDSPNIAAYELATARMLEAIHRLKAYYGGNPELLAEIAAVMSGDFDDESEAGAAPARRALAN